MSIKRNKIKQFIKSIKWQFMIKTTIYGQKNTFHHQKKTFHLFVCYLNKTNMYLFLSNKVQNMSFLFISKGPIFVL